MNKFLEILYLVSNEELKLVLPEELSNQRAKKHIQKKYSILNFKNVEIKKSRNK